MTAEFAWKLLDHLKEHFHVLSFSRRSCWTTGTEWSSDMSSRALHWLAGKIGAFSRFSMCNCSQVILRNHLSVSLCVRHPNCLFVPPVSRRHCLWFLPPHRPTTTICLDVRWRSPVHVTWRSVCPGKGETDHWLTVTLGDEWSLSQDLVKCFSVFCSLSSVS